MPYINQSRREWFGRSLDDLTLIAETLGGADSHEFIAGDLNYAISRICDAWARDGSGRLSYAEINAVIGVLECVKQEFYRRVAVPYEDQKCGENGDVYNRRS